MRINERRIAISKKMIETALLVFDDLVMMPSNLTRVDVHFSRVAVIIV